MLLKAHPTETKDCNLSHWIDKNKSTLNTPRHASLYRELQSLLKQSVTIDCSSLQKYTEIIEIPEYHNIFDDLSSIADDLENVDINSKTKKQNYKAKRKLSCSLFSDKNSTTIKSNSTKKIVISFNEICSRKLNSSSSLLCFYVHLKLQLPTCKFDDLSNLPPIANLSSSADQSDKKLLKIDEEYDPTESLDEETDNIVSAKNTTVEDIEKKQDNETEKSRNKDNVVTNSQPLDKEKEKVPLLTANQEEQTDAKKKDESNHSVQENLNFSKLKEIEIQLLKLENRFLLSNVEKRNDSLSLVQVENHILRLENFLLSMNNTLALVQAENNRLKEKQNDFDRTITQVKMETRKLSIPALPDSHSRLPEQVVRQEKLVINLKKEVDRQKLKVSSLEAKNSVLIKAMKKQTNAISKLLKKFDQLTEKTNYLDEHVTKLSSDTTPPQVPDGKEDDKINTKEDSKDSDNIKPSAEIQSGKTSKEKEQIAQHQEPMANSPSNNVKEENRSEGNEKNKETSSVKSQQPVVQEKENEEGIMDKKNITSDEVLAKANGDSNKAKRDIENINQEPVKPSTDSNIDNEKTSRSKQSEQKRKDEKVQRNDKIQDTILYRSNSGADKDCWDYYKKGRRRDTALNIQLSADNSVISVSCDMTNGGWTIIQKRHEGSTNFFRDWSEYKKGFGQQFSDHWIGLDNIHKLTNQDRYSLRIDMMNWERETATVEYEYFSVDNEANGYKLNISGFSGSEAGDSLSKHNGWKFSTKDVDNDGAKKELGGSCAKRFNGAWWYHKCYSSNLNGLYYRGGKVDDGAFDGVSWKSWTGSKKSLKQVSMKIRPRRTKLDD
ncbi:DgyrCDS11337 [Dimorphilus gyrociliatus]|uniref:DgyrCDS11337 n=1 Tax=Dimorphilus gyrociliatus TaxID=2664684 RepID=A0A7I8W304_9ANNE|nr:DgyrCDS11337 [Dimorphilus gyrociliatus]